MKNPCESGRTMLELLAVIGVMTVISMGVIMMYQRTMNSQKANTLYNDIRLKAVFNSERKASHVDWGDTTTYGHKIKLLLKSPSPGYFLVAVDDVDSSICRLLLKKDWINPNGTDNKSLSAARIYINKSPYEPNSLPSTCPDGKVSFSVAYRSGQATTTDKLPSMCENNNDCEGCHICTGNECVAGCPDGKVCYKETCVPGSCNGSLCCPTEQDLCEDGEDPAGTASTCPCDLPVECSDCGECGVCNPRTGMCEDNDTACEGNKKCYAGFCSICSTGNFTKSNNQCEACASSTVTATPLNADECHRCVGKRFYSFNTNNDGGRCTLCTAEKGNTNEEECFTCPSTFYATYYSSRYTCYYCDQKYATLNMSNRSGRTACTQTSACPSGYAFHAGRCRACSSTVWDSYGYMSFSEASRCLGIYSTAKKAYLFWESGTGGRLLSCADTRDLASTKESCLACNQPDSTHKRYWSGNKCKHCGTGTVSADGTTCTN